MQWLRENWLWLIPVIVAVLSALNRATVHWSEIQGAWWKRLPLVLLSFLVDLASVLRSKGEAPLTKLPLLPSLSQTKALDRIPTKPDGLPPGTVLLLLLTSTCMLASCATWKTTTLKTTAVIQAGVTAAHAGMEKACKPTVSECRAAGCHDLACCPKLQACFDKRAVVLKALDASMRATLLVILAVDLGDKPTAINALATALDAWRGVTGILSDLGVDVKKWSL